jgi:hypothetical protein
MVFQKRNRESEVKGEMYVGSAAKKGGQKFEEVYHLTAGNERILPELIFHGDSAQHVF